MNPIFDILLVGCEVFTNILNLEKPPKLSPITSAEKLKALEILHLVITVHGPSSEKLGQECEDVVVKVIRDSK